MDQPSVSESTSISEERARASLRRLVDDAEQLLRDTSRAGDDSLEVVRERFAAELGRLRRQFESLESAASARVRHAAQSTDHAVHAHPYAAMGITAMAGLLLGFLLARR
jgi:ElaB/YqjD/DUF883 family membrane-anchored ribosome-binding protein